LIDFHISRSVRRCVAMVTQQNAADGVGVQRATIANWESGRFLPALVQFRALLTLYAASPYFILYGSSRVGLSDDERDELQRLTRKASIGLQMKISLVLTMLAVEG
jgi:transcriptional regulator with XRE-family HTH domain